jgi:hypothetical protein
MSTFSAYGMGPKGFLVDRPLNEYEKGQRLSTKMAASQRLHYDLSVIKMNSTYVECVDKWYPMRGFVALAGVAFGGVICFGLYAVMMAFLRRGGFDFVLAFLTAGFFLMLGFAAKFFRSDAFTYTHYPIRFNRQNRQVYAFRRDGSVLKAGWDDFYWTIYNTKLGLGGGDLNVMGHLLDKDGVTVKESIALSLVDAGEQGRQNVLQCFEFYRRFMEEGPGPVLQALKPTPLIMLPGIHKQRESWYYGWQHLTGGMKGLPLLQVLFQPFLLPISLFRWLVMRTSKIPQWPQWVEDECRIDPHDPWVRDERHAGV